jgi:NAD(P)-dependent dehydrogenase (short-subunit alcohol dehydrogenase family)
MSRSESFVDETIEMFARDRHKLAIVECDLSDPLARRDVILRAAAYFGSVDVLINNAAANPRTPPSAMTLADRRAMFEINLQAPIDLAQQCLPAMRERGWGRIVNLLGDAIRQPPIPYSGSAANSHAIAVFGASKVALERYTLGLAIELGGSGIQVNGVYPHRVCVTEEQTDTARAALQHRPDLAEGVEMMAEAAMMLVAGPLTGISTSSRQLLQTFQQPLMALDGVTVIGDANTIPDLG